MGLFTAKPVLVVDGTALLEAKGVRGSAAPRQQLQLLRALVRTAERENLSITVVFSGRPLDKAPHNKVVEGVRTRYAKTDAAVTKELKKALTQAGPCGVLVLEDAALETKVRRGGNDTLRISTFRKILDESGDQAFSGGGSKGGGDGAKRRPRNNRQERKPQRDNRPRGKKGGGRKQERPPQNEKPQTEQDAISQMIDLVD
jgi:hypothetical protein